MTVEATNYQGRFEPEETVEMTYILANLSAKAANLKSRNVHMGKEVAYILGYDKHVYIYSPVDIASK